MAATTWWQLLLGALAILLVAHFIHVESVRFLIRLLRLPDAKTGRLHLTVFLSNVVGLGWLLLLTMAPLSFFLLQSGPRGTYYGGRDELYFLMNQLPSGWMIFMMLSGYVLGLALAMRHLLYSDYPCYLSKPWDESRKSNPGSEGVPAKPGIVFNWSHFLFISFASTGVAFFFTFLFGLFLFALLAITVSLGR